MEDAVAGIVVVGPALVSVDVERSVPTDQFFVGIHLLQQTFGVAGLNEGHNVEHAVLLLLRLLRLFRGLLFRFGIPIPILVVVIAGRIRGFPPVVLYVVLGNASPHPIDQLFHGALVRGVSRNVSLHVFCVNLGAGQHQRLHHLPRFDVMKRGSAQRIGVPHTAALPQRSDKLAGRFGQENRVGRRIDALTRRKIVSVVPSVFSIKHRIMFERWLATGVQQGGIGLGIQQAQHNA
ncbi:hypothetical protein VO93_06355 [Stenotrophomonas maltophilia]|nr:hypothetical protein VO93_06355 [Stenotrophomonas maltophilia]